MSDTPEGMVDVPVHVEKGEDYILRVRTKPLVTRTAAQEPADALIEALRYEHRCMTSWGGVEGHRCLLCGQDWPCHAIEAADLLAKILCRL